MGSEGLDVLVLESSGPGARAVAQFENRNYLGFLPVSRTRACRSRLRAAQKFGAEILIAKDAKGLAVIADLTQCDWGRTERSCAHVVIASGAQYRRLHLEISRSLRVPVSITGHPF